MSAHGPREIIRPIIFPAVLLVLTNVLGGLLVMPISLQLLFNTCCCVYIGCIISTRLAKNPNGTLVSYSKLLQEDESVIGMDEAKQFPLIASAFLFGFYLLYKVLPPALFKGIVTTYFSATTVYSISALFLDFLPFSAQQKKVFYEINIPQLAQKILQIKKFQLSVARIICIVVATLPVAFYFVTKHWTLNNTFGILFTIVALKGLNLSTTKAGLFLLWALFFYDIFWVYGTDVMVTVAKNLDIPVKIQFPFLNGQGEFKTSMVGLGDLVIPGIFISLCLKFDIDLAFAKNKVLKSYNQIELNYFNLAFVGYFYGIVQTYLVMVIFEHPQPALLFLVPMCTIPVLIRSLLVGQFQKFFGYDTQMKDTQSENKQIKQQKEGNEQEQQAQQQQGQGQGQRLKKSKKEKKRD